jgi:hypothetical protein
MQRRSTAFLRATLTESVSSEGVRQSRSGNGLRVESDDARDVVAEVEFLTTSARMVHEVTVGSAAAMSLPALAGLPLDRDNQRIRSRRQTEQWSAGARAAAAATKAVWDRAEARAKARREPFVSSGEIHAEARAAAATAAEKYERRHRRPRWLGGKATVPLAFVDEQDEGVEVS